MNFYYFHSRSAIVNGADKTNPEFEMEAESKAAFSDILAVLSFSWGVQTLKICGHLAERKTEAAPLN